MTLVLAMNVKTLKVHRADSYCAGKIRDRKDAATVKELRADWRRPRTDVTLCAVCFPGGRMG